MRYEVFGDVMRAEEHTQHFQNICQDFIDVGVSDKADDE